jgi:hypothetical protein
MISSVQGKGMDVRKQVMRTYHAAWTESRDRHASDQTDAFYAEMRDQGRKGDDRDFEMRIKPAIPELAACLHVDEGELAQRVADLLYAVGAKRLPITPVNISGSGIVVRRPPRLWSANGSAAHVRRVSATGLEVCRP